MPVTEKSMFSSSWLDFLVELNRVSHPFDFVNHHGICTMEFISCICSVATRVVKVPFLCRIFRYQYTAFCVSVTNT